MLAANQPQSPKGTAVNASMMLGLPGLGNELQDQLKEQQKLRATKMLAGSDGSPGQYGGGSLLGASGSIFGMAR